MHTDQVRVIHVSFRALFIHETARSMAFNGSHEPFPTRNNTVFHDRFKSDPSLGPFSSIFFLTLIPLIGHLLIDNKVLSSHVVPKIFFLIPELRHRFYHSTSFVTCLIITYNPLAR